MPNQLSRRDLLLRGGMVVAGIGVAAYPGMAWAGRQPAVGVAYRMRATDDCCCKACHSHAANKLFVTRAAAEHTRAHEGCRCVVTRAAPIDEARWLALFGSPAELHRTSVDRRWTSTRRVLTGASGASSAAQPAPAPRGELR